MGCVRGVSPWGYEEREGEERRGEVREGEVRRGEEEME